MNIEVNWEQIMVTNGFVKGLFVFVVLKKKKRDEIFNRKKSERFYSSVWKHGLSLIQSIDWKRIRDADSHIKLFVGNNNCVSWKSWLTGGVIVNLLVLSVTNGPMVERKQMMNRFRRKENNTNVQLGPNNVFH
jgi:hypothetical protein